MNGTPSKSESTWQIHSLNSPSEPRTPGVHIGYAKNNSPQHYPKNNLQSYHKLAVSAFQPSRTSILKKTTQLGFDKKIESDHHIDVDSEEIMGTKEEYEDLMRKDIDKRTVLHRAALDHQFKLIEELTAIAKKAKPDDLETDDKNKKKKQEEIEKKLLSPEEAIREQEKIEASNVKNYVNEMDNFGNSSLICACIKPNTDMWKNKCIKLLLKNGAEPNIQNADTLWTPLTWCACYGEAGPVSTLLKAGSYPFLPDRKGLYPLDYCGIQDKDLKNKRAAQCLIQKLKQIIDEYESQKEDKQKIYEKFGVNARYVRSPLLRSSLLYWCIYFKMDESEYLKKFLQYDGFYPDLPIKTISGGNCYHACCISENVAALNILLETNERYIAFFKNFAKNRAKEKYGLPKTYLLKKEIEKIFELTYAEENLNVYAKSYLRYIKDSARWIIDFEENLIGYSKIRDKKEKATKLNYFELKDKYWNTPLHVASFLGKDTIVSILLNQEGINVKKENKDSWRCEELKQFPKIENLYREKRREEELNQPTLRKKKNKSIIKSDERLMPDVVLVFKDKPTNPYNAHLIKNPTIDQINFNIQIIRKHHFKCYLARSIDDLSIYLMIKSGEEVLGQQCRDNNIKIKLFNSYNHQSYDIERKTDFEPFRSRQRQEITLAALEKIIDIQQLKELDILAQAYSTHTVSGTERIRDAWIRGNWYWPEPLPSFWEYLREGNDINFKSITTLRMYFGEKVSFYFAWNSFYTCYLAFLAVPGLIVYILTKVKGETAAYLLPLWVVYNAICSTLVIEKWKRKSAEIATRWGTIDMIDDSAHRLIMRKEFFGDETISETTGVVTKHSKRAETPLYFFITFPILLILLAIVVASFLYIKDIHQKYPHLNTVISILISSINGVIITVVNIAYGIFTNKSIEKENHKYTYTYERSKIFKVFIFQFFNSYLGVIYLIFVTQDTLDNIQITLISLLLTKQLSSIITTLVVPWAQYEYAKYKYFKRLDFKIREQQAKNPDLDEDSDFSNNCLEENIERDGEAKPSPFYRAPVLDCDTGKMNERHWDLTRVELNSKMLRNDDFTDDYGQLLIQCGYIVLFAPAFPIGPALGFVANIIEMRAKILAYLNAYHRPPTERAGGIGYWLYVWEIMSIVGTFVNAVILFFSSNTTSEYLEDVIMGPVPFETAQTDIRRLWLFLIIVYLILSLKILSALFINDKPKWVVQEEKKLNVIERKALEAHKHQTQNTAYQRRLSKLKSKNPEDGVKDQEEEHKNLLDDDKSSDDLGDKENPGIKEQDEESDADESDDSHDSQSDGRDLEAERRKELEQNEILEVNYRTPKDTVPLASIALRLNKAIKTLFFNTYAYIEKEITLQRLSRIEELINVIVIKCGICQKRNALLECLYCEERYCSICLAEVHDKVTKKAVSKDEKVPENPHKIMYLAKHTALVKQSTPDDQTSLEKSKDKLKVGRNRSQKKKRPELLWNKVETFNFPMNKNSDAYQNLLRVYDSLYRFYVDENGISTENTVTDVGLAMKLRLASEFPVGTSIRESNKAEPEARDLDYLWQEQLCRFCNLTHFNTEEKLLMNRIAFFIFKRRGAKTTFTDFYRYIKIIQEGTLESKSLLLFDLLDEDSDGSISTKELSKLLEISFVQHQDPEISFEEIVREAFSNSPIITKKAAFDAFVTHENIKEALKTFLQLRNDKKKRLPAH